MHIHKCSWTMAHGTYYPSFTPNFLHKCNQVLVIGAVINYSVTTCHSIPSLIQLSSLDNLIKQQSVPEIQRKLQSKPTHSQNKCPAAERITNRCSWQIDTILSSSHLKDDSTNINVQNCRELTPQDQKITGFKSRIRHFCYRSLQLSHMDQFLPGTNTASYFPVNSLIVLDFSNAFFSSTANNKIYQIEVNLPLQECTMYVPINPSQSISSADGF